MIARLPTGLIWPWQLIWNLHMHFLRQHGDTTITWQGLILPFTGRGPSPEHKCTFDA